MNERRVISIRGTVQGVGFRPFVYGLATRLKLSGHVSNSGGSVIVEIEGEAETLDRFLTDLTHQPPPLARIQEVTWERRPTQGDVTFQIVPSSFDSRGRVIVSPDVATCDACLAELFDPNDRRYCYPFLNCTNCGPRLTIITVAPYDRQRTTMSKFEMCSACRAEYEDPRDRRFHAQPIACPACGPRLAAFDAERQSIESVEPLRWFAAQLRSGSIGALKGLGGYHLACDAGNDAAVLKLRLGKHRDAKPFAIMVADIGAIEAICWINDEEHALLTSVRRPIVLLRHRPSNGIAANVAPHSPTLGVMLPYTPLHHLLMREMGGPLVMTSGNRADEPIAIGEPDVFEQLAGIVDVFLTHDRPIHVRADDSVTRVIGTLESPVRRSRGYAPQPIDLPVACPAPLLAVGAQLKGTFALGADTTVILSHHLGDLDHLDAFRAFENDVALYERLFEIQPLWIAHDLHPNYASTRYAIKRAQAEGVGLILIQHHEAHVASCMAEHGRTEPLIGVSFDGTGYGSDGAVWGGEFFVGDLRGFRRAAHLRYVSMPGGEQAIKHPWRMALAHLQDAGVDEPSLCERIDPDSLRTARRMIERKFNAPSTSSIGRLFDAVASLLGLRDQVSFEGQAAMELESLATGIEECGTYPFELIESAGSSNEPAGPLTIDTRPMVRAIVQDLQIGNSPAHIARCFHSTVVHIIVHVCATMRRRTGLSTVALSGGVFMNALLTFEAEQQLTKNGFCTLRHRTVPTNDGGISLGQLAIAAEQLSAHKPNATGAADVPGNSRKSHQDLS